MYTVIKAQPVGRQIQSSDRHKPEVIDHRRGERGIQRGTSWVENIPYKTLKYQRDTLLESEMVYKKQLKDLQKDKDDLLKVYEPTCEENKYLRSIIKHGPDAVKLKKLGKAKRDLEFELDRLKDENKRLSEQMKALLTAANSQTRDEVLERQWQTILTSQSKADIKDVVKKDILSKNEKRIEKTSTNGTTDDGDDLYDVQLDSVKKSLQLLLNNVKQLQKEKRKVDYALTTRKGAIVGNEALQNAIKERLNKDLDTFKTQVTAAESKTSELNEQFANSEKQNDGNFRESDKQQKQKENDHSEQEHNQQEYQNKEQNYEESRKQHSPTVTRAQPQLIKTETCIVISRFATVQTQTDLPQNNESPIDETKSRSFKKKKIPTVESRAIQTKTPNTADKAPSAKPVKSFKAVGTKTTSETVVSKTQRRLEYAEKLLTNRSAEVKPDIEFKPDEVIQDSTKIKQNTKNSTKSEPSQMNTPNVSKIEKETQRKRHNIPGKKVVNGPQAIDAIIKEQKEPMKSYETKTKPKSLDPKLNTDDSVNITHKNDSTAKRKRNNENTRTQVRVKSKSVGQVVEISERDDFRDKIIDKITLPKITTGRFVNPSHGRGIRSDNLQSLPDIRKSDANKREGPVRQNRKSNDYRPQQRPMTASTIDESRSYSDSGIYYRNVGRTDTPMYNGTVPDFEYVVKHREGKTHYIGKPISENIQPDPREDAYNEVLHDLMNQQRHANSNVVNEFNKTLRMHRDITQPNRTVDKRSPSIEEDSLASQSLHSSKLFFNTRGKDVSENEMKALTHR